MANINKLKKQAQKEEKRKLKNSRIFLIDFAKHKKLSDIKGMVKEVKFNQNTDQAYMINMFMRNGTRSNFIIFPDNNSFVYKKKRYVIDEEYKYYENTTKNWALSYHEDISLPINISIDTGILKKKFQDINPDVSTAINPHSLETYMKSSFVEKIMKGEEMDKTFKKIIMLGTVAAVSGVITVLLLLKMSGILDQVGI